MKSVPIDIGSIRREQIVEAAVAVIAEQGIQNLSLSEIEKRAGMSRGQLTYYFPTKEDIFLAVFDHSLRLIYQRLGRPEGTHEHPQCANQGGWELIEQLLHAILLEPPAHPEFGCLQYTFLSQMSHRDDFRQRLASLYEQWRSSMGQKLAGDLALTPAIRTVSPRAFATLVQAILHGLAMQATADPNAFDRGEMLELCLDLLKSYLWAKSSPSHKRITSNPNSGPEHSNGASKIARRPARSKRAKP